MFRDDVKERFRFVQLDMSLEQLDMSLVKSLQIGNLNREFGTRIWEEAGQLAGVDQVETGSLQIWRPKVRIA